MSRPGIRKRKCSINRRQLRKTAALLRVVEKMAPHGYFPDIHGKPWIHEGKVLAFPIMTIGKPK